MRLWLALGVALASSGYLASSRGGEPPPGWHQDTPNGPVSVEGIQVSGHLDAVSVADLRQAITAFNDIGLVDDLVALTVMDKGEIRGYVNNHDLGWFTAKRETSIWPDRSEHSGWNAYQRGLPVDSAALDFIRAAPEVFVFPVANPSVPHRDDTHMRLLGSEARSQLTNLLGTKDEWFQGLNDLMYPPAEPGNVGFIFRNGNEELVLFLAHSDVLVGTFNGEHLSGTLNMGPTGRPERELEAWVGKYAKPELATLAASPRPIAAPRDVILVDDVNAVGNLNAVSESDLHDAKKAFKGAGLSDPDLLKVIDKNEIHAYLFAPDVILGWMTASRVSCEGADYGTNSCWHALQQHILGYADALHSIEVAPLVYVFPITATRGPRMDAPHLRLLEDPVRRQLEGLLGSRENWIVGSTGTTLIPPGPKTDVGFKFLDGKDEVILFFSAGGKVQGTFNGEYMSGDLAKRATQEFEMWKSQNAQSELAAHD